MAENYLLDGSLSFIGGQDASKSPDKIPPGTYAGGVNLTTQNANLGPRWRYDKLSLTYTDQRYTLPTLQTKPYSNIFRGGRFQAVKPYKIGNQAFAVIVVNGIIYLLNLSSKEVQVLELPHKDRMDETSPRINVTAAEGNLVFHDYPNYPVIMQGFSVRRADPKKDEVPISVLGTYNQNRIFIANNSSQFTAGDPAGNLATPEAPLTFIEILEPSTGFTGQAFSLPTAVGTSPITAMGFLQLNDQSTGIGPLIVATKDVMFWFQSQITRALWENSTFGSAYINDAGIVGSRAHTNVGSDFFFMSSDGFIRSANMSRQEQGQWSRAPVSFEVKDWIKFFDKSLMPFTVLYYFGSKIFCTVNPYRLRTESADGYKSNDVAFGGMVVLELDNVSTLAERAPPVWAGLWTGIDPLDFFSIDDRLYAVAKYHNENTVWEINPNLLLDHADGKYRYVTSRVYTPMHSFHNPRQNKDFHSVDFNVDKIQGNFELKAEYRPSQSQEFIDWNCFTHDAPFQACGFPDGSFINGFQPHSFREIVLGAPPQLAKTCNPYSKELMNTFRKIQLCLTIKGANWELQDYEIKALIKPQTENQSSTTCQKESPVPLPNGFSTDWVVEDFDLCQPQKTQY